MVTVNVAALAADISQQHDIPKKDAETYVKAVFDGIAGNLSVGHEVNITGFGKFVTKSTAERQGRNPATGAAVTIAASTKAVFKAAKQLKDAL